MYFWFFALQWCKAKISQIHNWMALESSTCTISIIAIFTVVFNQDAPTRMRQPLSYWLLHKKTSMKGIFSIQSSSHGDFFLQNIDVTFSPLADDSNKFSCKFSILEFSNETTTRAVWVKYLGNSLIRLSKDKFLARQRQTENALKTEERKLTFSVFRSSAAALHCSFVPLLPFIGRS